MPKVMHLICNAHIDPIWQWDWPEGASVVLSTFQSAVNLAAKHDYIFCHNEVAVYKYVEEYAPELFEQIRTLVKQGKWHIMGGWYLQPDCNMPSGESFVRQIQEGRRYFMEKFGVFPTTAVNFDPFGHTVGLVQILKKCGQDSYLFMRPSAWRQKLPSEQFLWKGLDGSTVKAVRCPQYGTALGKAAGSIQTKARRHPTSVGAVPWGVGNHGGGPSDKDLTDIAVLMQDGGEVKYIHSTPEAFFKAIAPAEEVDVSLRISMPGCYTSMYKVKKKHALLENELFLTEKMLSAAYARGLLAEYPADKIHTITEDLLNAQFHDVLPGTSIQSGEENGLRLLDHGLLEAERLKTKAYFALASVYAPAKDGEYPIVVFNPHPYAITENVQCEFMLADQNWDEQNVSAITVRDEAGCEVVHQQIKEDSNLNLDWRKRIIFEAKLAPMSCARYSVYVHFEEKRETTRGRNLVYDDGHKYVEIDAKTGLLKKYVLDGVTYAENAFQLMAFDDNADPWGMSEEQMHRMGSNGRPFALSEVPDGVFRGMKSVQVTEDGPIYLGIEAFFEHEHTRARIGYKIYKNNDAVDVDVDLFLSDINRLIKLAVPVTISGRVLGQTAFGTEELFTDGRENVAHRFVAVDNGAKCLALMNNGVYGSHFENDVLYMSLMRGVTYCAHPIADRPLIPEDRFTRKIDQGESSYSFRLCVTGRNRLERTAQEFVQKPYGLNIFPLPYVPEEKAFSVTLTDDTVSLVTMKKADDGRGILFRLLNNTDAPAETELCINALTYKLVFGPFEVKTVRYENDSLTELPDLQI
ncbi:MAG: alpha-mannosidase [Clostridia bacterium]|nr:alpha-mannosidase [Clostridia bacterium]